MRSVDLETAGKLAPDRLAEWALIACGVVTAIYVVTSLALPFGWDQGIMASVGSSYVHGGLPYVDSWDMKGPAAYMPYALAEALFGRTMWGIRVIDAIVAAIASFTFYKGVRNLTGWRVGAWAAFTLYYWIASAGWWFTASPESWTSAACVIAIVPLLTPDKAPDHWRLVLAGALIGFLGLIKPFYLAIGIAPLLSIALAQGLTLWRRAGLALALTAGATATIVLVAVCFAWRGGLSQAVEVYALYNLSTYGRLEAGTTALQGWAAFFARPTVSLLAPFAALGIWTFRRQPQVIWPTLGWLAAVLLAVAAQGKYYFYHWMPAYAPLLLLAVLGGYALARADAKSGAPLMLTLAAALAFSAEVLALPMYDATKSIYYLALKRDPGRYYASYSFVVDGAALYNAENERAAARYIAAHTKPDDGVFIWGNDATVRYLANRPNPSRFTAEMPLSLPGGYLERYRAEAMRELRARPPTYFVVGINWWRPDTREQTLAKFPELSAFLKQGYSLEKSFGILDLYRRKAPHEAHTSEP